MPGTVLLLPVIRGQAAAHSNDALKDQGEEQHQMEDVAAHNSGASVDPALLEIQPDQYFAPGTTLQRARATHDARSWRSVGA